jgi:hypothetical protein
VVGDDMTQRMADLMTDRHARTGSVAGLIAAAILLVALATVGCTTNVTSTNGTTPNTVTATGTGTGSAAPDTAVMSFSATALSANRITALNDASKVASAVIAAVESAGVDATGVQTTQVSVSQQTNPNGTAVTGYQAVESINVTTGKLDRVGAIIAAATNAGATDISGPNFSLSDTNAAGLDAITKAVADAKARAGAMAQAAGRTLGPVVSITEVSASQPFPIAAAASPSAGSAIVPPVSPGQVQTQVQLTVVFALQ